MTGQKSSAASGDVDVRHAEALLKTGALQSAIFNSANFSCIATDAKGVIQIFNVGAERMLGYTAAETVNRITPADLHDSEEVIARAAALSAQFGIAIAPGFEALVFKAARGIEDIYELTKVRKDGSRFPAVVSVTALRDAQDAIIGYLLIGTDNTARYRAEEERKKLDQRLRDQQFYTRSLIESNINAMVTTDPRGIITDLNRQMEALTGCTRDELIGTPFKNHFTDSGLAEAAINRVLTERNVNNYELTVRARDGSETVVSYNASTFYNRERKLLGVFAAAHDITDRKQVENELRASEERFRALVTASSDVIYRMSPDWTEMRQLRGQNFLADTETPSSNWLDAYIHPDDRQLVMSVINEAIRTRGTFELEHRVRRVDGTFGWTLSRAIAVSNAAGDVVEWFGAASDVTERKLFDETLRAKNIELIDASRLKSEFLANMSHELRTPLNSIIGFSEVLRDGLIGEMTDKQRGFIGDISSSGKHLLSLINDILDLSKVEAGKMALELEPVLISSLLANSLSIIREKAAANDIHVSMDAPEALGSLNADARKVKQIVYNLLSNAVKFTRTGGHVLLHAGRVPRAEVGHLPGPWMGRSVSFADTAFAEFLEISVTDSGIGIPPDALGQLFKPFSQIDSGLARKFEGTGLGLALVKLLAELHGGSVAVESAVDEGSCFRVWLPLRAPEATVFAERQAPVTPPVDMAAAVARVALVVEDDDKSAELIRLQLEAEGFTVLHAASAEAALVLAVQQPVSLITLDILLPNMEGWEFLTRLKQVPDLARTPVVIISIVADSNKGFSLGAAAVMQKPVSRQALYESLVDVGLFPLSRGQTLKVLVVDDDPKAVELLAVRIVDMASTVLRAYGGREAIDLARQEVPDVIVLDLMMPEVTGFDVVQALSEDPNTACIPILVVTAKEITTEDRAKLNRYVTTIIEKTEFDPDRFAAEIRRAMSGRPVGV
jgi:PAS domain S-box-containing protein